MTTVCSCGDLRASQETRLSLWRDVSTRFFFQHDAAAKRVLDHFENTTVDQIVIEAQSSENANGSEDDASQRWIAALQLSKCAVLGHQDSYDDAVIAMERVKNEVRGAYHRQIAVKQYEAFDQRVLQAGQSTNLDPWTTPDGHEQLVLRVQDNYVRSAAAQSDQQQRVDAFVKQHVSNIGCHPFLAGLRLALEWNLASTAVIAWKTSDAVFVESGSGFADAAVKLLVQELNCGHITSPSAASDGTARHRVWYLDPYMSDYDLKQLLKLLPTPTRLESRGTGEKVVTNIHRSNADGSLDEYQPFFQKWCVIL